MLRGRVGVSIRLPKAVNSQGVGIAEKAGPGQKRRYGGRKGRSCHSKPCHNVVSQGVFKS